MNDHERILGVGARMRLRVREPLIKNSSAFPKSMFHVPRLAIAKP